MRIRLLLVLMVLVLSAVVAADDSSAEETHTVSFAIPDGTVISQQQVAHGGQVDLTLIPSIEVPDDVTVYWGAVTQPIYQDTTFTATFVSRTPAYVVSYYDDSGSICLYREVVKEGDPATYDGVPSKASDDMYDYVFAGWSQDLSKVTSDMDVKAVFDPVPKGCEVNFYDYDRTLICVKKVPYGEDLTDMPENPTRPSTVGYSYTFVCWSITPNGNSPADFTNITDTLFVFAFYQPSLAEYTVRFHQGSEVVMESVVKYNSAIGAASVLDMFDGGIALMYRDPAFTRPMSVNTVVIGDTDVYVREVPGIYEAERDSSGSVIGNVITVKHDDSTVSRMVSENGRVVLYDISQFGGGCIASIGAESIKKVAERFGDDAILSMSVPRGTVSIRAGDLVSLADDDITLAINNGPSSIKITSALKRINYSAFYSIVLRVGGHSITELPETMSPAAFDIPVSLAEGLHGAVWNITSRGALEQMEAEYANGVVSFSSSVIQFYAVGTDSEGAAEVKEQVVVPYGDTLCTIAAEDGVQKATVTSMAVDCLGGVMFVPSSFSSRQVIAMDAGALNDVKNAVAIVIPGGVERFSWENWSNTVPDVYFLGDAPQFTGEVPSSVTVYRLENASGWDDTAEQVPVYLYDGAYKKDPFSFYYYIVNGEAVVHRYVTGVYVQIPKAVAAAGSEYPVSYIGCSAFMWSSELYDTYGLRYTSYNLETVEIPSSVRDIMTDAFRSSTLKTVYDMGSVERIWDGAFSGCTSLSGVTYPDTLLYIGSGAFRGCSGKAFAKVNLPDGVRVIGDAAFYGCNNVTGVKLGKAIEAIPADCFGFCSALNSISIPDSVKTIGEGAFFNCSSILYMDLNNVVSVGRNAFANSGSTSMLECVVFGESLATLGSGSFSNCASIAEIEAYCARPDSMDDAFNGVDLESVSYYVETEDYDTWKAHYDKVELLDEAIEEKNDHTMTYVSVGLLIFFIIAGILSFRYRMK